MPDKKILIITYYWPPSGGSGVQRWLKMVKYLPQFGWSPIVFTPENPALVQQDSSLLKDVLPGTEIIRFPIWEPYDFFFRLSSFFKKHDRKVKPSQLSMQKGRSVFQQMANWIRGNFFIPDPKIFWVRPSVKFLAEYVIQNNIQVVVTTGPPHSMHLIGYRLKKRNPSIKWIADFRDPWSEWPFLDTFNITKLVRGFHKRLERKVLATADTVVTITPFYQRRFEKLSGRNVALVTNGFDEDDFSAIQYRVPDKFFIRHVGIVYQMANPDLLIEVLIRLSENIPGFRSDCVVEFLGEVNGIFRETFRKSSIAEMVVFRQPVPHKELFDIYGSTCVLHLNLDGYQHAEGLMPGKLFEYLATGLPILGVGPPDGDTGRILTESNAGRLFDLASVSDYAAALSSLYDSWKRGENLRNPVNAKQFSRRKLTEKFVELF